MGIRDWLANRPHWGAAPRRWLAALRRLLAAAGAWASALWRRVSALWAPRPPALLGDGTTPLPRGLRSGGLSRGWLLVVIAALSIAGASALLAGCSQQRLREAQTQVAGLEEAASAYVTQLLSLSSQVSALTAQVDALASITPPEPDALLAEAQAALAALTAERDALTASLAAVSAELAAASARIEGITRGEPVVVSEATDSGTITTTTFANYPLTLLTGQTLRATVGCPDAATACQVRVTSPDGRTAKAQSFLSMTTLAYTNDEAPGTFLLTVQPVAGTHAFTITYAVTDGYAR